VPVLVKTLIKPVKLDDGGLSVRTFSPLGLMQKTAGLESPPDIPKFT
jgi:hypothetical protein